MAAPSTLALIHKAQRALLAAYASWAGASALATLIVPRIVAREILGVNPPNAALLFAELWAGMRLTAALVALMAAYAPRPPRALVWALGIGLAAGALGLAFVGAVGTFAKPEVKPFLRLAAIEGIVAALLLGSSAVRAFLRRRLS